MHEVAARKHFISLILCQNAYSYFILMRCFSNLNDTNLGTIFRKQQLYVELFITAQCLNKQHLSFTEL